MEIQGTDLDRRVVARAREGVFGPDDARTAPPALLRKHFEPTADGGWRASAALKRMVRFDTGDLLRMPLGADRYEVILCRDTVIYFTEDVRGALHERLVCALAPGGYLLVGTSERVTRSAWAGPDLAVPLHLPQELMETAEYLPMFLAEGSAVSGGAVLSDGQIALIIDCDAVADHVPVTA